MDLLFFSAAGFIKEREFSVLVPAFYHPHLTEEEKNPKPKPLERPNPLKMVGTKRRSTAPFHQIIDPMQLQKAAYSVEVMIDMVIKKVEFTIINDDDLPEIFDGIDRYLMSLKSDIEHGIEPVIAYAKEVLKLREVIYKHYYRYMMTNPTAKEALYPNNSPTKNLLHLMMLSGGKNTESLNLDPLVARGNPPYDILATVPTQARPESLDDEMGASFGLSNQHNLGGDDGKDFDLDDFIRKV